MVIIQYFLDPCPVEGPIKSLLSVCLCLPVCLSVCLYICLSIHQFGIFLRNGSLVFWYLAQWQIIRIFKSWQSPYFHKNSFLPKFDKKKKKKKCKKWPQNSFIWIFWKILSFSFSWKTNIVIDISPLIPYLAKFWFLIYGSKCCQPIKEVNDDVYFWHIDKHCSLLQVHTINFSLCIQVCPKYSNNEFTISLQNLKENVKDEVDFLPADKH